MKKHFILLLSVIVVACSSPNPGSDIISLKNGWKIKKGDNHEWASPQLDDSDWNKVVSGKMWENQELDQFIAYDGYAWYRISFELPEDIRKFSYFGEFLQLSLGKVDDTEQTYLNGELLGANNELVLSDDGKHVKFEGDPEAYSYFRNYIIPVDDKRINWGGRNVIAIRVHDHGGGGGMSFPSPSVSMVGIKDYFSIDVDSDPYEILGEHFTKNIQLKNKHESEDFSGDLTIRATRYIDGEVIYETSERVEVKSNSAYDYIFSFSSPSTESHRIEFIYKIDGAHFPVYEFQGAPYILTPPAPEEPRINGPAVFGVRPGNPLLYTIPVSGNRPIEFAVEGLPEGVVLDSVNGYLRGSIRNEGDYPITLIATNQLGSDRKSFTIKVGDAIQLTPPMGWNSWNCWGLSVSDEKVRSSADAMVASGLVNYGWSFMNIDDGWEAGERTYFGELLANEKFPDMKGLADYIHGHGLKLGIYSSPGPLTCGGHLGSYQHELRDARTWAAWDIDYLKYDWCSYSTVCPDEGDLVELKKPYHLMRTCLDRVNRDIVYSLCQYGMGNVSTWGAEVGGNLWRTTYDIVDTWESLETIGFVQDYNSEYNRPGGYNDPDMMILGWVGWGPHLHPTRLSADEQYSHVSLWCLLGAPLLLGNDLSKMDDFTISLLTNQEVLAINQDALCKQAKRILKDEKLQVWVKELSDGSHSIGFFNMDNEVQELEISLGSIGFGGKYKVRDLWRQVDISESAEKINLQLMPHGVSLVTLDKI
jgi:alpha-galactosidase